MVRRGRPPGGGAKPGELTHIATYDVKYGRARRLALCKGVMINSTRARFVDPKDATCFTCQLRYRKLLAEGWIP